MYFPMNCVIMEEKPKRKNGLFSAFLKGCHKIRRDSMNIFRLKDMTEEEKTKIIKRADPICSWRKRFLTM